MAAYFLDHDARSYELISRVFAGESEGLTRDDILDNITITWLTNTALSGARLYWENWGKLGYFNAKGVSIPVAVSVFPDELYPAPRSWAERAYPKLIHYNRLAKGGHFAAWEQPQLFSEEVRAGFRSLRGLAAGRPLPRPRELRETALLRVGGIAAAFVVDPHNDFISEGGRVGKIRGRRYSLLIGVISRPDPFSDLGWNGNGVVAGLATMLCMAPSPLHCRFD